MPAKTGAQAKALSCTTKRWLQGADLACGPGSELARACAIIAEGWGANPQPATTRPSGDRAGRRRRSKAASLLARLDDHREQVLRFATDFRVPFDNNQAERDIRMAKLQQKISGGWRTLAGAQRFCRLRSYISTARKQQVGVLAALRRVFEGDPWLPAAADP